jgi:hypothetical protein
LHLAETTAAFLGRLLDSANTLDVTEHQRIVRLVVKEILIGDDNIVIRHGIPIASMPPSGGGPPARSRSDGTPSAQSYLYVRGVIGDPCGVPRPSSRLRVLRRAFPRSSVSSTGACSHILIRCSIARSTTRRATDLRSSACGRLSKCCRSQDLI